MHGNNSEILSMLFSEGILKVQEIRYTPSCFPSVKVDTNMI